MGTESAEYYRLRERAERAAAAASTCAEARRVHQEMAEAYAQLAASGQAHKISPARDREG